MTAVAAYYNEIDPFAAAWLRELIAEGLIAPGEVDERSIEDVAPEDLRGFVQCHFFAGIGVWSLALRLAGWPDHREIWTGSCPCQPFSAAGKGAGFDDERHLWPAFEWVIANGKPRSVPVVGEQVASADGLHWLDLVSADVEGTGHAFGALDTCAAGFGSPHIRQRLYWLADGVDLSASGGMGDAIGAGLERYARHGDDATGRRVAAGSVAAASNSLGMAHTSRARTGWNAGGSSSEEGRGEGARFADGNEGGDASVPVGAVERLAVAASGLAGNGKLQSGRQYGQFAQDVGDSVDGGVSVHPLAYWRDADWLLCRDPDGPRFRPVEPGSFPLVDARFLLNRLAAVRGAGNAINLAQAQGFIEAVMECRP